MRRIALLLSFVLVLSTVAVLPAGATHGSVHPTFRSEEVWFHCTGDTKVYNVNWTLGLGSESTYMPWDTTAPAGSVADGAGCGSFDLGGITNPVYDPVFRGYFTGNLRDLTVRLHHLVLSNRRNGQPVDITVQAVIDGVNLFPGDGKSVQVTPTPANSGATEQFEFSITNIGIANDILDEAGNIIGVETGGAAYEDGDGAEEHELTLFVGLTEYPEPGLWAWDSTEVPSGITFNPEAPAAAQVQADLPPLR